VSAERSFAAPQLYDLYGPVQFGEVPPISFNDYGGGVTEQATFNGFSGPNTHLSPAKANTWTAGFVYEPKALKGLTLTADYFEAFDKDEIGYLSVPAIVQSTELLGPASPFAQFVHFGSPVGPGVTGPGQLSTSNPSDVYIQVPVINLASQTIKGFDIGLAYNVATVSAGRFEVASNLTAFNSYLVQALPTENYYQYAGDASGAASSSQGTIPKWRSYTTLEWSMDGFSAVVGQTLVPKVTDIGPGGDASTAPVPVGSYQQYDLIAGYDFSKNRSTSWLGKTSVRLGVDNAFNRMPPVAVNAFPGTNADVGSYGGAVGRLWFIDADYHF
jgi:iron complex outermembrane receptor protein